MKKLLSIILLLISISTSGQNRYSKITTSSFKPLSSSEISNVALTLQKRYNVNQKYLYNMKKWILELKPQISEENFLTRLNKEYKDLTNIEDGDLARATKYLNQTENAIREIISDYNIWVKKNNSKIKTKKTQQNNLNISSKNEIEVAHIMIRDTSYVGKKIINEIYGKLIKNESFEYLVKKYSQDIGSNNNGGNLGKIGLGRMIPEFENVAFSLNKEGEFSKPFKTRFGLHIVKLIKKHNFNSNINKEENLIQIGIKYYKNQKFILAIRSFSKYLETNENNTDAIFFRAMAKVEQKDFYGAISDYDKVIELNSNYPMQFNKIGMVYNNKAYTYVKQKKYNKALAFVEKALKLDKLNWHFWDTRGEIYLNLGQYEKALSDLNKAIKIKKNDNSYYLRGLTQIKLGKKEKGCKDLSKSGELGNSDAYEAINKNCN